MSDMQRRFHTFRMELKESREEWADIVHTDLDLDLNEVVSYWRDKDGGTCIETVNDSFKVTETFEEVRRIVRGE